MISTRALEPTHASGRLERPRETSPWTAETEHLDHSSKSGQRRSGGSSTTASPGGDLRRQPSACHHNPAPRKDHEHQGGVGNAQGETPQLPDPGVSVQAGGGESAAQQAKDRIERRGDEFAQPGVDGMASPPHHIPDRRRAGIRLLIGDRSGVAGVGVGSGTWADATGRGVRAAIAATTVKSAKRLQPLGNLSPR